MRPALLCGLLLAGLGVADPAGARIVHREQSLYSTLLIDQQGSRLCLQFSVRRDQRNQSCIDTEQPRQMVFGYTRMMMTSLLLNPSPERILVVGLGGGTLPMALAELYPEARIDAVEIDPAVVRVARRYFGFDPGETITVHEQDARVFTKRARLRGRSWDLIMLDAYNGEYIPEHLMTREYLDETRDILAPDGVLAANTFAVSQLYHNESRTYQAVFGEFFNLKAPDSANRIIITTRGPLPPASSLLKTAGELSRPLARYGIRLGDYLGRLSTERDWDPEARVLTDQYAPVNLLKGD